MSGRTPEKWFSLRTDFFSTDAGLLGIYNLSPAAHALYLAGIAYACRQGIEECHRGQARMLGIKRPKPVVEELVENGFWLATNNDGWYFICHEGTLWRRGDGKTRRTIPLSLRKAVMERDGYACVECGRTFGLTIDHIFPYSLGGQDTLENLRVLCRSCNSKKGARL